jgi:16S rRNA (adenine1518-N6/adenine1519-N6)-dimethyltransferase
MKAKKSLGQNFLKSEMALKKIIEAGEIKPDDIILEIGPGKGALTKQLLAYSCQLIAVEKDKDLCELLKNKFEKEISTGQLKLINGDILDFDLSYHLKAISYKLIANIPYNITGAILKKFLTEKNQPERMILMVQHEVAKRIVASDKKESILSISVKAYGEPKMIMKVPARYFSPSPKVDSAIIAIKNISRKNFLPPLLDKEGVGSGNSKNHHLAPTKVGALLLNKEENRIDEEKFWEIVKTGFAHKRKKLSGNLKSLKSVKLGQLGDKRAEDLTLADWINLAKML